MNTMRLVSRATLAAALSMPMAAHAGVIAFDGFTAGTGFDKTTVLNENGFDFTQVLGGVSGSPRFVDVGGADIGIEDGILDVYGQWTGFTRSGGGRFTFDSVTALNRIVGATPTNGVLVNGYLNGSLVAQDHFYPTLNTPTTYSAGNLSGLTLDQVNISNGHYAPYNMDLVLTEVQLSPIPEPSVVLLLSTGLTGLWMFRRLRYRPNQL